MIHQRLDTFTVRQIHDLVKPDLQAAKSATELRKRLLPMGYGVKRTPTGIVLTAEPHSVPLFKIQTNRFNSKHS